MGKYGGIWKYQVMGKYGDVSKYWVQIWEWVIMVAMSTQMYHDLHHHLDHNLANHLNYDVAHHHDHDLADQHSLSLYLEWVAYELEWMAPRSNGWST